MRPAIYTEAELVPDLPVPSIGHNSLHTDDVSDWPPRAIFAIAELQERLITLSCEEANRRVRLHRVSPVLCHQISSGEIA